MGATDTDATTERIRSAALRLFVERGYGTTTIEHISTAAEVGVATIYRRWPDKAAIANDLYRAGIEASASLLEPLPAAEPHAEFVVLWRRVWEWASANRELFLFINTSVGASWISSENRDRKAEVAAAEVATYARLRIDASPDLAAALIGGTIGSVLATEPDVDPDEVAQRLWRALTLDGS